MVRIGYSQMKEQIEDKGQELVVLYSVILFILFCSVRYTVIVD